MKMECDNLNGWIKKKNGHIPKNLTQNGEPKRTSWGAKKKKKKKEKKKKKKKKKKHVKNIVVLITFQLSCSEIHFFQSLPESRQFDA